MFRDERGEQELVGRALQAFGHALAHLDAQPRGGSAGGREAHEVQHRPAGEGRVVAEVEDVTDGGQHGDQDDQVVEEGERVAAQGGAVGGGGDGRAAAADRERQGH